MRGGGGASGFKQLVQTHDCSCHFPSLLQEQVLVAGNLGTRENTMTFEKERGASGQIRELTLQMSSQVH